MTGTIDPAEAIRQAEAITDEQLGFWMAYPDGREATIDAMGLEVVLAPLGRAAFRHRIATDPEAAAKCVCWDGTPPAVDLTPEPEPPPAWRWTPSKRRPGWGLVLGPYDDRFLEMLRARVPWRDREWMSALKGWLIRDEHRETVEEIARACS